MPSLLVKTPSSNDQLLDERERERDQARGTVDELKAKLDGGEDSLNQTLTELELSKNEAKAAYQQGYNEGINVATESYKAQMPPIQDEIWAAAWATCLKKVGVAELSPLWTENDLPSSQVFVEDEPVEEEGDSLDRELNARVSEQPAADAEQGEDVTNLGQKEAGGGPNDDSTVVEDTTTEVTFVHVLNLIIDE